ncbi:MAG TPA: hypothetical protein VG371_11690 [Solirubrobacteraceae bacterium]|nr:hypothetical protein [Solirubrobacteraceae bacterium]
MTHDFVDQMLEKTQAGEMRSQVAGRRRPGGGGPASQLGGIGGI